MILLAVFGVLLLGGVDGYRSGPPPAVCISNAMTPSHGVAEQSSPSPYSITLSATEYTRNGSLTVTLAGSEDFRGFLVLAIPAEDDTGAAVGSFQVVNAVDNGKGKAACDNGQGFSHNSRDLKNNLELKWTAPAEAAGNLIFYATFVQEQTVFWVKVESEVVNDGVADLYVKPVISGPVTDPPAIDAISSTTCGQDKSCYSDCEGDKCGFLLTWKKTSATVVEFELFATLAESESYVALGLSTQAKMVEVSIVGCLADKRRESAVAGFYAAGKTTPLSSNGPLTGDGQASIRTANGQRTMACRFSYDNALIAKDEQWKDLATQTQLYAFIARGPAAAPTLLQHTAIPKISPQTIDFFSASFVNIGGTLINRLIKAHACIMVLAWVFCASVGVILARYYKPMFADKKACGQKVWFSYHRALMLCAMFLTLLGFLLILINNDGVFRTPMKLPTKAHPILGLIAIIFALLNPLIAAFRCHPGDAKRPLFNWFHWFFGTVAHVFAIVAIFLGMLIESAAVPAWITYIMMAFCLFHVCVEFILEIHQCCMYDRNRDRQEEHQLSNKGGNDPQYVGRGFKCAILVIYMIVVTIITIALVVIIAVWGSIAGTGA